MFGCMKVGRHGKHIAISYIADIFINGTVLFFFSGGGVGWRLVLIVLMAGARY